MRQVTIDLENGKVMVRGDDDQTSTFPMDTDDAFQAASQAWLRVGWDVKHVYSFTWLGRPMIQLPEDMLRLQEVIYQVRPDVILELGVAHGGALTFYASICKALGHGRVIGVDVEIRAHNRIEIERSPVAPLISLIEGSSIDVSTLHQVEAQINDGERVLLLLDSCHKKQHVTRELELYTPLIESGSYAVVMDGIMESVAGAPRTAPDWTWNNPRQAALEFCANNQAFQLVEPEFLFNEGEVKQRVTYWPSAYLHRVEVQE